MRYFLAIVLALALAGTAQAGLLFDRGLPATNLNNAAGALRSNVTWASESATGFTGDDFIIGSVGENYVIDSLTVWGAQYNPLSLDIDHIWLYLGKSGSPLSLLATGAVSGNTNSNPTITHTYVNYPDGTTGYQGNSGGFYPVCKTTFSNLNYRVDGGVKYNFGVNGDNYLWWSHASNAALSGPVAQDGADGLYYNFDSINLSSVTVVDSNGNGWDKSSDVNVQVTGVSAQNVLSLDVVDSSLYIQPGQSILVNMNVANLTTRVNACQAVLGYSSTYFADPTSGAVQVPGSGPWDDLIWDSWTDSTGVPGEIDTAIGMNVSGGVGSQEDGTVAKITLTSLPGVEGVTQLVFRPDVSDIEGTLLSDLTGQAVWPAKVNSTNIIIDGTPPTMAVVQPNGGENLKGGQSYEIKWTASDANIKANSIKLEYYDGSAWQTIASGEANDGSYMWTVPSLNIATAKVRVSATDLADNTGSDESDAVFKIDSTVPDAWIMALQNSADMKTGSSSAITPVTLQGSVLIVVTASDVWVASEAPSGLAAPNPVTVVVAGVATGAVTGGGGIYSCTATIDASTANGAHLITVTATDKAGNVKTVTDWIYVNKNQITGEVQLEGYAGTSRVVTFVASFAATGGASKTWSFTATGHITPFTLTDVPDGATNISAKTEWSLRTKLPVSGGTNNQWTASFTGTEPVGQTAGAGNYLRGGDINRTNSVNVLDYSILKTNWLSNGAVADINGDGQVSTSDYAIMKSNWFKNGQEP